MSGKKGGNSGSSQRGMLNKALSSKGKDSQDREKNMRPKGGKSEEHSRRSKGQQSW